MFRRLLGTFFGLAMMGMAGTAHATLITQTYEFSASTFSPAGAPVDPVEGSFTVTFDPLVDVTGSTSITVNSLNITYDATLLFNYVASGELFYIGANSDVLAIDWFANDFRLVFSNALSDPTFLQLYYVQGDDEVYINRTTGVVTAVPEPASMLLFGVGLIGLVGIGRRRRKQTGSA